MLKHLSLKNLVLIDSCEIEFVKGLNILSGETGAGKTAVIEAIHLAMGHRADSAIIRKGADKASVEAAFEISFTSSLFQILEEGGIAADPNELLIIRREISRTGKNRAFINCQMAALPILQKIGGYLIDLVSQHSHHDLRGSDAQRSLLDLYGDLEKDTAHFFLSWTKEKEAREKLDALLNASAARQREMDICRFELQEITDAGLGENEEEKLFEEHSRMSHAQELTQKLQQVYHGIANSPQALIPSLSRHKTTVQSLLHLDPALKDPLEFLQEASVCLNEAFRLLSSYLSQLESDPKRFEYLETRLSAIQKIKRKYGTNFEEIDTYKKQLQEKLSKLENLDQEIEEAKNQLETLEKETGLLSKTLSEKRLQTAAKLQSALTQSIQELNMERACLTIEIKPQSRSSTGEDAVNFWLAPNLGEPPVLVKESSSGGELSRLMLAIKTTLAEKNHTPVIIFDEIDANVGGETAGIIGEKLQALGKHRQILCITHFPQVAAIADHHLLVYKEELEGRTLSFVKALTNKEKEKELLRMLGGKKTLLTR
jgi:DNA repair protein RecN (Recombination protein N)